MTLVAHVSKKFAEKFAFRLTKQGLGKVVPAAGIVLGVAFNWATLESIVDVANIEYQKRFLLEKYPHLTNDEAAHSISDVDQDAAQDGQDEGISVLDELAETGASDLR